MDITNKPKPVFPGPKPPAIPGVPAPKPPIPSAKPLAPPPPAAKPAQPAAARPKAFTPTKPVAQKPPIPAAPPAAKPASPSPVAIHTMKDDLSSLRNPIRASIPAPAAKPLGSIPPSPATTAKTPSLPIAPLTPASGKSVVIPSGKPKRGLRGILTVAIVILIAFLAAGAAAWYFLFNNPLSNESPIAQAPKSIQEMLPANATVVTQYQINDTTKEKIEQLFSQPRAPQPTFDSLLAGDPRLVFQYADVKELYYIQLSGDSRPYLVSPETSSLTTLFEHSSASQTLTQNGWRLTHPVNVGGYTSALSQGTMNSGNGHILLSASSSGLQIYVSPDILASAIAKGAGISTTGIGLQSVTIKSDLNITGGNLTLFDGLAASPEQQTSILKADPALVGLVPSDAQFVYAGNDLGSDIQAWSSEPSLLAPEIISQPQVKQILTGFSGLPYVFYRQASALDTTPRFGVIIKLTPDLVKSLREEKVGLETALFALRPLISRSTAVLSSLPLFSDGAYNEIPLRYVNINGPSQALDYAISEPYLIMATSKDGMFSTLDVLAKKAKGLLEQNTGLAPANSSIQTNQTAQSILIMAAQDSGILSQALPSFVAAPNAMITILAAPIDRETQSISGLLAF